MISTQIKLFVHKWTSKTTVKKQSKLKNVNFKKGIGIKRHT